MKINTKEEIISCVWRYSNLSIHSPTPSEEKIFDVESKKTTFKVISYIERALQLERYNLEMDFKLLQEKNKTVTAQEFDNNNRMIATQIRKKNNDDFQKHKIGWINRAYLTANKEVEIQKQIDAETIMSFTKAEYNRQIAFNKIKGNIIKCIDNLSLNKFSVEWCIQVLAYMGILSLKQTGDYVPLTDNGIYLGNQKKTLNTELDDDDKLYEQDNEE